MKALVYERAHSLEDFAIKLAEISEPILRELDVLVDVQQSGSTLAKLSSAGHAAQNRAVVSCLVGNLQV
jgi:hypothetical protein